MCTSGGLVAVAEVPPAAAAMTGGAKRESGRVTKLVPPGIRLCREVIGISRLSKAFVAVNGHRDSPAVLGGFPRGVTDCSSVFWVRVRSWLLARKGLDF